MDRGQARAALAERVRSYSAIVGFAHQADGGYPEEQVRIDYIDPLLELLGWDLRNQAGLPHSMREVLVEPTLHHEDEAGRPDYTLRPAGKSRLFVEAKRPAIDILNSQRAAAQVRKYGWSAGLGISVLTNFRSIVVYDTRFEPTPGDGPEVARIPGMVFGWEEYLDRFDELWAVLSREAVSSDEFLVQFGQERDYRGADSFDHRFLERVRSWRLAIAEGLAAANATMSSGDIGRRTQQILNSLVFLRVCEDRSLTAYEQLRGSASGGTLPQLFVDSDLRFNAGLFRALDGIAIAPGVIERVVEELYYPNSPYAFSVVDPAVLANIYEQFLGERVERRPGGVHLIPKPEVIHSGGVAPTPAFLVAELAQVIDPYATHDNVETDPPRICDPACGSGPFLLVAYRALLARAEAADGSPGGIGLARKRALVSRAMFGVDIDDQAVEVARLSLLLALLDGETAVSLAAAPSPVLPDLSTNIRAGNSLVDPSIYGLFPELAANTETLADINVFDWQSAFPEVFQEGGFDLVLGNPPWVRIQVLAEFFPDQLRFFQSVRSGYESSLRNNFDVYMLFVEKSLALLDPGGTLAFVLPHRFMTSLAGRPLRQLLSSGKHVRSIIHFGHLQLFPGRSNYVCLLVLKKAEAETFHLERVTDLDAWRRGLARHSEERQTSELGPDPWTIAPDATAAVFERMKRDFPQTLEDVADIFVGVQTSADGILMPVPRRLDRDYVDVGAQDGSIHRIERAVTRPAIRDRALEQFDEQPEPDAVAIFPYEIEGQPPRAALIPPDRMAADFPGAWAYLLAHREQLEARALQGAPGEGWYRYGRSQSLTLLDAPKIVVRVMSTIPRYAFDPDGLVAPGGGDGGPYYFIRPLVDQSPEYQRYLIALLSHPIVDAMVVANGRAFRGGYYVHRKQFLKGLPVPAPGAQLVPIADAVASISRTVIALRREADSTRRRALEQLLVNQKLRCQELVSIQYRFTVEELGVFEI